MKRKSTKIDDMLYMPYNNYRLLLLFNIGMKNV